MEYRVNGAINSTHKYLTLIQYETFTSIVAWYTLPIEFIKNIEEWGYAVKVVEINREKEDLQPRCWACGTPVPSGDLFCNEECRDFRTKKEYA